MCNFEKENGIAMNVYVVEKEGGRCVATYPVVGGVINALTPNEFYFEEAWKCAVDDCVVQAEDKEKYTFTFEI